MTIENDIQRAQHAQRLLDDELLNEAFEAIRLTYLQEWENSPVRDVEGREKLWTMLKLLDRVKGHLQSVIDDGKVAAHKVKAHEQDQSMRKH